VTSARVAGVARAGVLAATGLTWAPSALAVDVSGGADPVRLDVTETTVVAQHFDARSGESPLDSGYGDWLNRLNLALSWQRLTLGGRLDSSYYWLRPVDQTLPADLVQRAAVDADSRFRDALYPAKLWATYATPGFQVIVGDAYAQFGRGLVLSMRKIDELGIDTTVRGAKIQVQSDPFAATVVAGLANPNRVDEATGRALFLPLGANPLPLFGSDRIVGAEIQAGRGLPVTLSTHAVAYTRCAPYSYDAQGQLANPGAFDLGIGSCAPGDVTQWLSSLTTNTNPLLDARQITMVGQTLEIPDIGGHGQLYVEVAGQDSDRSGPYREGNAVYVSASAHAGSVTETLEIKSYRNFYEVPAAIDVSRAPEFNNITYSVQPTAELITQDSELGFFNACVNGGRLRSDVRANRSLLFYVTTSYFNTQSEQLAGSCDGGGRTISSGPTPDGVQDYVEDLLLGEEWYFDGARSHLFASTGVRNDELQDGTPYYREAHVEYAFTKHLAGPFTLELQGRHRYRYEQDQNASAYWNEGENYTALKVAPKWVLTQGIEYTTLVGQPNLYFNGQVLYRLSGGSNVKLFVGQQRAGLRCVSGVCKLFPAFEGARVEVTVRF
jgi:hypothetical protein